MRSIKKNGDLMSKRVHLTLTDKQYELWEKYSEQKDMSIHDFIKQAVRVYITMLHKKDQ